MSRARGIEYYKELLSSNGLQLERIPEIYKDDPELVYPAVYDNYMSLKFASARLRDNHDMIAYAMNCDSRALKYASDRIKSDPYFIIDALGKYGRRVIGYIDKTLLNDIAFVTNALTICGRVIAFCSEYITSRRDLVLLAVKNDGLALEYVPKFQNDPEIVYTAIMQNSNAIHSIGSILSDDSDFMFNRLKSNFKYIWYEYASDRLQKIREYALQNAKDVGYTASIAKHFNADKEIVLAALNSKFVCYGCQYCSISDMLMRDPDIIIALIKLNVNNEYIKKIRERAREYISIYGYNEEQAIRLLFAHDNIDRLKTLTRLNDALFIFK